MMDKILTKETEIDIPNTGKFILIVSIYAYV